MSEARKNDAPPVAPLTERERLAAEVERLQVQYAQILTAWKPALAALREYDRTHPEEARDV